jgi:hypothetical protein
MKESPTALIRKRQRGGLDLQSEFKVERRYFTTLPEAVNYEGKLRKRDGIFR